MELAIKFLDANWVGEVMANANSVLSIYLSTHTYDKKVKGSGKRDLNLALSHTSVFLR